MPNHDASAFDRAHADMDLPETISTKASTIVATDAILGLIGTFIVQSSRNAERGRRIFLQKIDAGTGEAVQLILNDRVAETLHRQRASLDDRWRRRNRPKLSAEDIRKRKLRDARRLIREDKSRRSRK